MDLLKRAATILCFVIAAGAALAEEPPTVALDEAIRFALQHSPRLAESRATARAFENRIGQAHAPLGLQTSVEGRFSDADPAPQSLQNYSLTFGISKLLYDSGRTGARVEQARRLSEASQHADRQAELEVALDTTQAYYQVLKATQLQQVFVELLKSAEYHLELATAAYDAGAMPRADVIRAEVEVARQRLSQIASQTAAETALARLINDMGLEPGTPLRLAQFSTTISPPLELDIVLQTAYSRRPELEQAQAEVAAGQAAVRAAQTGLTPQLSAGVDWGYLDNSTGGDTGWSLGLNLSLPLSDGGDTRSRVGEARSLVQALQARQETVRQRVALEVTTALSALRAALEGIAVAKEELRLARHSMELAEGRYRVGAGRFVEVTDARVALSTALTDDTNAIYDYQMSRASVARAMGLLPTEAVPAHD